MAKTAKRKVRRARVVGGEPKRTRAEKRAERRAMAEEIRQTMRDPRGTHTPRQTRPITDQDVLDIIEAVASGDTVIGKCRELGLATQQFLRAKDASDEHRQNYERARRDQAEIRADEIEEIADEPIDPVLHALGASSSEIAHRTLRINTKRWLMGKYNTKFADKQTVAHEGGDPSRPVLTKDVSQMDVQDMVSELQARHRERKRT